MRVAFFNLDKPDHLAVRKANREAHVAYLTASGVVEISGPLLDDKGDMCGSLLVISVPDMAAARAFAEADPYAKAGLFQSVEMREWNKVSG